MSSEYHWVKGQIFFNKIINESTRLILINTCNIKILEWL